MSIKTGMHVGGVASSGRGHNTHCSPPFTDAGSVAGSPADVGVPALRRAARHGRRPFPIDSPFPKKKKKERKRFCAVVFVLPISAPSARTQGLEFGRRHGTARHGTVPVAAAKERNTVCPVELPASIQSKTEADGGLY